MSSWDGIDEFMAVATAGTFVSGARALKVSPSHVSRAIMALEQRIQAQLFHRTTRTVRLTDTGRMFLQHFARMTQERDEVIALINERGEPAGELRVTCSAAMGERFVAPILRRFASEYPELSVTIELSNRIVDIVTEGFDLAIRTGALSDSRLTGTRIASRQVLTCAAPSYLARHGAPAKVADLDGHDCVIGTSSTWLFTANGEQMVYKPSGRFRCNGGHAVIEAALAGMGVCQLPEFYVLPHLRTGELNLVLDAFAPDEEPIWAVYPERRHLLPKIRLAIDLLRKHLSAEMHKA